MSPDLIILSFLSVTTRPGCVANHHLGTVTVCLQKQLANMKKVISNDQKIHIKSLRAQGSDQDQMILLLKSTLESDKLYKSCGTYIEDLTRVVIFYEIYETSLQRVS